MPTYTNKHNLPDRIIRQLSLPYRPKEGRYSVTDLIDSPWIRKLKMEHWDDIVWDYSQFLEADFGTIMHRYQEACETEAETELKLEVNVAGVKIVGRLDVYDEANKVVLDNKWTKVGNEQKRHDKYAKQLNVYAWMLRKQGKEVTALIVDDRFKNWDWKKIAFGCPYPYPQIPYAEVHLPLWTFEEQEQYVLDQLHYHEMSTVRECSSEDRWESPTRYAVQRPKNTDASRVCNTREEAQEYIDNKRWSDAYIQKRPGGPLRCQFFCNGTRDFCPFWQNYRKRGNQ